MNAYRRREFLVTAGSAVAAGAVGVAAAGAAATPKRSEGGAPDLCFLPAGDLIRMLRAREVSAREVMAAHLRQIERLNPRLNAIVAKLEDERCLALADDADRRLSRGERVGPLHGLPFAFKDNEPARGFPYTRGSPLFKDQIAKEDTVAVERIRQAGAIPIGKTNVPEFALGSHTYNKVYGTTHNPYDPSKSAGGSSGGAAVALATGMLPLANGSDTGGSLRNPGNFNNVVGFRPTVGLVPMAPTSLPFVGLSVRGPLGRSVADAAQLLSVMAGPDPRDPGCYPSDPGIFTQPLERDPKGVRVAWCPDLGGLPLDPEVRRVLNSQRATFERLGCIVEEACPDFSGADDIFLTLRAFRLHLTLGPLVQAHRDQIKPEAIREVEIGAGLSGPQVARAMAGHAELMARMRTFQEKYDFLLCAVNQVPPFDASLDWPREIAGVTMEHYIAWMRSAYWITLTHCPAISVPAGFTSTGLPVGLQIVGRQRADLELLRFAHAYEQATRVGWQRPKIAAG